MCIITVMKIVLLLEKLSMPKKPLSYAEICLKNPMQIENADFKMDKNGKVKTAVVLGGVRSKKLQRPTKDS